MRRALLLCLGLAAVTWLEFQFFPGHSYLEGDTQIYLPMLERLDAPGFLSRDLVATHPNVTYTIYDELTLCLHAAHLDFHAALVGQQLFCRAAAILGVFLLALSTGMGDLFAFALAAVLNLGATLSGPAVSFVDREPVPRAFAFALILLAAGLLAREKPLLSGLAAGVATVYDPAIAAPFWIVLLLAFACDARLRSLVRPALPILLVFALLLANLAQLQPGVVEGEGFFSKISDPFAALIEERTKAVWVSVWAGREMWHYAAIFVFGIWATARIWPALNRQVRWFLVGLPICGLLSVLFSYVLLDRLRWPIMARIEPSRALLYTVVFASLACGMAAAYASFAGKKVEASLWLLFVVGMPLNVRILDFFHFERADAVNAGFDRAGVGELATWAADQTWGSSMFLFPDAGRALYPGVFRAESRRALWVDWESGKLVPYSESFAAEWWQRWEALTQEKFSAHHLQEMLPLPVDYFVLQRQNQLRDVRPVFRNREFVVYDAGDLRDARKPLALLPPRNF